MNSVCPLNLNPELLNVFLQTGSVNKPFAFLLETKSKDF